MSGISFVLLVIAVITADGKLSADMQPFPSCPDEKLLRQSLEESKQKGEIRDFYIQCSITVAPVKRSEAEDQNRI